MTRHKEDETMTTARYPYRVTGDRVPHRGGVDVAGAVGEALRVDLEDRGAAARAQSNVLSWRTTQNLAGSERHRVAVGITTRIDGSTLWLIRTAPMAAPKETAR